MTDNWEVPLNSGATAKVVVKGGRIYLLIEQPMQFDGPYGERVTATWVRLDSNEALHISEALISVVRAPLEDGPF